MRTPTRVFAARALVLALLATLLTGAAVAAPASATSPCNVPWGSLHKAAAPLGTGEVLRVRTGSEICWDRVVFDLAGPASGYSVRYVDEVTQDGSGFVVPVPGGARLQVTLHHPATTSINATVNGYPTLRAVVSAGSFEGYTTVGVGVRARLPFRVFTLSNPPRIVVDIAHRWT